ncbi:ribosome biogenesis GTPase Der [Clostridium botulinum]|uniref:GTPase Der n=1 Tax=Clostridium botulinum C/D str. DC5 TaxID=1443128 RepID=A0A0A0IK49_CLOBO|nr:ribosome biogenesis GTPase Der [Clostridium botulinum]KEI01479.1 GTP-binding protein Der [Clostridium botulinum C/D str. BKT75002]KEI07813.1 GTP-binding protein Der [Clostridium botulinum C/D str. BKT2873]KGM94130.1 GTP-binding protein Der [Clostridium botulinum D str. CCUG 7971]KGN01288.1 GTP-binding protein Der [Clostridium botulinum C/D str. DC5]KOC49583.1 GTP-binding protein Der [Clostridium botulinum]
MGKPIVAIVGRPNVGKSTLFNKLAGKRIAIVDDMPGVTRDRIYAQAEWLNNKFTIIDTGGIEPESEDVIVAQMRRQAQMAIEMADVVLFIVDGKQGLADADREVAQMLRKANKSIVLAVNKIDRHQLDDNIYEFYNLGLGDPMAISASQGLGLGDLLDEVVDKFPQVNEDDEENEYIRIAMVGRPNVGKSSLINRILGEEKHIVSNIPGTTRDSVDSYIEREEGKFALIDTAGLRRKSKIKEQVERYSAVRTIASIENADVCILMLDAEQGIAEQDEKIIGYAHELNKAIIVIVNKWDLIEKDDKTMKNFKDKLRYELSFLPYASFLFISAKTGQRVNKVLGMAKECYNNYCKRVKTGILNEVISKAILMKEPPIVGTSRLKIYYVTQIGTKPPTFIFFVNNPELVHFSYRRYLENQLRENFDFSGTGIKLEFRERKE